MHSQRSGSWKQLGVVLVVAAVWSALVLSVLASAQSADIVVNATSDSGAEGVCELREAILNANADADLGNDCEGGSGTDMITFSVSGVITLTEVLPTINDNLTIDGSGQTIAVSGGGSVPVMRIAAGALVQIHQLSVSDGFTWSEGGGILNEGTLHVFNSVFSENYSTRGGAIFTANDSFLHVSDSSFIGNMSESSGSAIGGQQGSTIEITKSQILDDKVPYGDSAIHSEGRLSITESLVRGNQGGGIESRFGTLEVSRSTVSENHSFGIHNVHGRLTITDCEIAENYGRGISSIGSLTITGSEVLSNTASQGSGGGITHRSPSDWLDSGLTIANSTISGNSAPRNTGGGIESAGSITITNSTVANNSAYRSGGISFTDAVYKSGDVLRIENSTIHGNSSEDYGGGIQSRGSVVIIVNSSFTANQTDNRGGAIFLDEDYSSTTISGSLFPGTWLLREVVSIMMTALPLW